MNSLEISSVSSACGKNQYEPRSKCMLYMLAKKQKVYIKQKLLELGIVEKIDEDTQTYDDKVKEMYKEIKKEIKNPSNFKSSRDEIISKLKSSTDCEQKDVDIAVDFIESSMKKDCGTNNEGDVISKKRYKKGNNFMYTYVENFWCIKGFNDASVGDVVIEIKTRMKLQNVRKNEYDLYQLFGYLLAMNKTKGKIVQYFNNKVFDSDVETEKEYGIIDINTEPYYSKFKTFLKELRSFFFELQELLQFPEKFDIASVFTKTKLPIAQIKDKSVHNINPQYERLISIVF